jgi:hypothetical protein
MLTLAENGGEVDTFILDVFDDRPAFEVIVQFQKVGADISKKMTDAMTARKNCAISWVQLVIDHRGLMALVKFKHVVVLGQAKKATKLVLKGLYEQTHAPGTMQAVEHCLRPLDEVDKERIAKWEAPETLRPSRPKRKRCESEEEEEDDEKDVEVYFTPGKRARVEEKADPPKKSAQELLAELSASDSEDDGEPPQRLALTDAAPAPATLALLDQFDHQAAWHYMIQQRATVIFAEAGARPDELPYIRCHRENRRQLLLQGQVKEEYEKPTLLSVVRVAMKLAADGKIPGIGKHGRRSEFMERCSVALAALDPKAEADVTKLPAEMQALIRHALGGKGAPYEGCFTPDCLDKEALWETSNVEPMSRCARCKCPKSFGRTVKGLSDILRPTTERCKAHLGMETWRACKVSVEP